jgi:hypothetical protein
VQLVDVAPAPHGTGSALRRGTRWATSDRAHPRPWALTRARGIATPTGNDGRADRPSGLETREGRVAPRRVKLHRGALLQRGGDADGRGSRPAIGPSAQTGRPASSRRRSRAGRRGRRAQPTNFPRGV